MTALGASLVKVLRRGELADPGLAVHRCDVVHVMAYTALTPCLRVQAAPCSSQAARLDRPLYSVGRECRA